MRYRMRASRTPPSELPGATDDDRQRRETASERAVGLRNECAKAEQVAEVVVALSGVVSGLGRKRGKVHLATPRLAYPSPLG
jgi:hypothetical protein